MKIIILRDHLYPTNSDNLCSLDYSLAFLSANYEKLSLYYIYNY